MLRWAAGAALAVSVVLALAGETWYLNAGRRDEAEGLTEEGAAPSGCPAPQHLSFEGSLGNCPPRGGNALGELGPEAFLVQQRWSHGDVL